MIQPGHRLEMCSTKPKYADTRLGRGCTAICYKVHNCMLRTMVCLAEHERNKVQSLLNAARSSLGDLAPTEYGVRGLDAAARLP
jgi:hypothetical protein